MGKVEPEEWMWGAWFSLNSGSWYPEPVKVYKYNFIGGTEWYAENGNDNLKKKGLDNHYGLVTFASKNKTRVQQFIDTVNAVRNGFRIQMGFKEAE